MNDDIKEILQVLKESYDETIPKQEFNRYLKYIEEHITNLQQENERLKVKYNEEKSHQINYNYFETLYSKSTKEIVIDDLVWKCEELDNFKKEYEKLYIDREDYKSRCEKAVEIANDLKQFVYDELVDRNINGATETHCKIINLLNILKGEDDE